MYNTLKFLLEQGKIDVALAFLEANRPVFDNPQVSLGFEDVAISQAKNLCKSRLDTNIQSEAIRGVRLAIPLIAANMSYVTNADFCTQLSKLGALGVMHRAAEPRELLHEVKKISRSCSWTAASVGVGSDQLTLCNKLVEAGANIIVIDIAHGYSDEVITLGKQIKSAFPAVKLVLGNTINIEMLKEVSDFADALKVGIGQGLSCETKNTAACTEKQFSAVYKFRELSKKYGVPIISDGGIREPSDFVKAIAAGANSVMAGSIFAKCPESAAPVKEINGVRKKVYAGMASRRVQNEWKKELKQGTCPEGKEMLLDLGESVHSLLERYSGALRSGITYAGAVDVATFQERVKFIRLK